MFGLALKLYVKHGDSIWKFANIHDKQAFEVVEKINSSGFLETLEIKSQKGEASLGVLGGKAILNAVQIHPTILSLNLDGNNEMGDDIAQDVFNLLVNNTTLTTLSLRGCGLTDKSADMIANAITINKTLKTLCIETNHFENGFGIIREAAKNRETPLVFP